MLALTACGTADLAASSSLGKGNKGNSAGGPTVLSSTPLSDATGVPINGKISATFSEEMESASLTEGGTFTVTTGDPATAVKGVVAYAKSVAVFWPAALLVSDTTYTAMISTSAKSATGITLATPHKWTFTTGSTRVSGKIVNLGTAGTYAVLAKSAISTVPTNTSITGNIGISPAAHTFITGFSQTPSDASPVYSTSTLVNGNIYAANYALPTPTNLTVAVGDMELAFTDASGRAADVTELGAGDIGGMTLIPGVYKWGTGLLIPTDLTLNGSATDVWIFQIAQDLTVSNAVQVTLAGGALPKNVFWQVTGAVSVGTTAHMEGNILSATAIDLNTGSSINGRLLAQTAVSINASTVVEPAP
jgi:hypothetical protein